MNQEDFSIIKLTLSKNLKYNDLFFLFNKYKSAINIINNINEINSKFNLNISIATDKIVEKILNINKKLDIDFITFKNDKYSQYLTLTDCYPFVLYYKGNIDLLNKSKTMSIVGSRNTSINSIKYTEKISKEIGEYGYTVVSGMAKGIDASAHRGAIKTGTIAVLGSGVDIIYPQENRKLYSDILSNNGLIISEFIANTQPQAHFFPQRNRIIAGLSKGVLIVNAGKKSGTIHTANQALRFNREIMVFPGNPYDERHIGANQLLKDGATFVLNSKDIIENLEDINILDESLFENKKRINGKYKITDETTNNFNKYEFQDEIKQQTENNIENDILINLDHSPLKINELVEKLTQKQHTTDKIHQTISKLELENKIVIVNDNISLKI